MNHKRLFMTLVVIVVALGSTAALAQDEPSPEEMQAWMQAGSPGPHHKSLSGLAGTWKVKITSWMGPSAEPMVSEGKSTIELVLDGRYAMERMESSMMGMPYVGMGLMGHDNIIQKHTVVWVDNMGTHVTYSEGDCSDHCGVITSKATMKTPMGGTAEMRMVSKTIDADNRVFEMYSLYSGADKEFKSMEIVYTRAK